jgi:dTDP-4-amino-4,6-dideoxy-D-galactose acyltransferase
MGGPGRRLKGDSLDIKRLDWDSQFLGREVYGVTVAADADVAGMVAALRERDASIAYLFVGPDDAGLHARLTDHGAVLYDEKVTYGKELKEADEGGNEGVEVYKGELTDQLLALAILAGHESRFRKDPGLRPFFEPLYKLWMINSLKGTMADAVLVYRADAGIRGMVTCKTGADGIGRIGLIATDGAWQGKGVGRRLMKAAQEFFLTRQMDKCTVVTQRTNTGACGLYERSGFTIYKMEIIYHLWFN